jgi:hypothetical protein
MYTTKNYRSKKALKTDVNAGVEVSTFQPGPFPAKRDEWIALEGPHYPESHRWYASALIENGIVKIVK